MARVRIKTNDREIQKLLTENFWSEIQSLADSIALEAATRSGLPADGRMYSTDRAHGVAMITHPKGASAETKGAHLRSAATGRGLEVGNAKGER